jgi:hypothetical protein
MSTAMLLYRYFISDDSTSLHLAGLPLSSIIRVNWLLCIDTADNRRIYTHPVYIQRVLMSTDMLLYRYFICDDSTSLHVTDLPLSAAIRVNWLLRIDTASHRLIFTDPIHLGESTEERRHAPVSIFHM